MSAQTMYARGSFEFQDFKYVLKIPCIYGTQCEPNVFPLGVVSSYLVPFRRRFYHKRVVHMFFLPVKRHQQKELSAVWQFIWTHEETSTPVFFCVELLCENIIFASNARVCIDCYGSLSTTKFERRCVHTLNSFCHANNKQMCAREKHKNEIPALTLWPSSGRIRPVANLAYAVNA